MFQKFMYTTVLNSKNLPIQSLSNSLKKTCSYKKKTIFKSCLVIKIKNEVISKLTKHTNLRMILFLWNENSSFQENLIKVNIKFVRIMFILYFVDFHQKFHKKKIKNSMMNQFVHLFDCLT